MKAVSENETRVKNEKRKNEVDDLTSAPRWREPSRHTRTTRNCSFIFCFHAEQSHVREGQARVMITRKWR